MSFEIKRGEMYYSDLSPAVGSEQSGVRPVLVIQNDKGNFFSTTVVVAAITDRTKKTNMPTHCLLPVGNGLEVPSVALLEQVRTIDKLRLLSYIGKLDESTIKGIDRAIAVSMGFDIWKRRSETAPCF